MPGRVAGVTRWKTIDILLKTFEKAIQSIYDPHLPGEEKKVNLEKR